MITLRWVAAIALILIAALVVLWSLAAHLFQAIINPDTHAHPDVASRVAAQQLRDERRED